MSIEKSIRGTRRTIEIIIKTLLDFHVYIILDVTRYDESGIVYITFPASHSIYFLSHEFFVLKINKINKLKFYNLWKNCSSLGRPREGI